MTRLDALPDAGQEGYARILESLSKERQERIAKNKNLESKKQLLGAGALLQKVLDIYGLDANTIYKDSHGKPMLEGIHFNLTHTDGLVLCAVGNQPVGCDAELIKKAPRGIAERFFCTGEKNVLHKSELMYDDVFYRLWTMKESYIKMTGEGMSLPMDAFEIQLSEPIKVFRNGVEQSCYIKEYEVLGYKVAVCSEEKEFSEQIVVLNE